MLVQPIDERRAAALARDMTDRCLGVRVGRLHRLVSRRFDAQLRPIGMSLQQLEVLSALTACGAPVKPAIVADLLAVERSTMSRNLAVLADRGWIRSTETSVNGRALLVTITPAGTSKLAAAADAWENAQSSLSDHLDPQAHRTLDTWLTALTTP